MKNMVSKISFVFLIFSFVSFAFSFSSFAGTSSGTVSKILAHAGDVVMFSAGSHVNMPACSTQGDDWAFSLKNPTGAAMYALLVTAAKNGHIVHVVGSDTCSDHGDRERPLYIQVNY